MGFFELFLEFSAEADDLGHVRFIECRENCGGLLCLNETFGDFFADFGHRHARDAVGAEVEGFLRRRGSFGWRR